MPTDCRVALQFKAEGLRTRGRHYMMVASRRVRLQASVQKYEVMKGFGEFWPFSFLHQSRWRESGYSWGRLAVVRAQPRGMSGGLHYYSYGIKPDVVSPGHAVPRFWRSWSAWSGSC